jgi:nucleotide-binding universal stress UspA family protein
MSAPQTYPVVTVPKLDLKHILVTTDFSDCSRLAVKQAAAIAQIHGSHLFVLHVVPPEPTIDLGLEPATWGLEATMASAKAEIPTAEQEEAVAAVPHQLLVESGSLAVVLQTIIKEREIALLVLGPTDDQD